MPGGNICMIKNLKTYYEELAKNTLAGFVDGKFSVLKLSDKPDLQSNKLGIGIEVRECKNEQDGRADAFTRETFGTCMTTNERQAKMEKMGVNGWLYQDPKSNAVVFSQTCELFDVNKKKEEIANFIAEKAEKFNAYKKFNLNCLYLFCHWNYERKDIDDVTKMMLSNPFDCIFFDCLDCVFAFDSKTKHLDKYDFRLDADSTYGDMLSELKDKYWRCRSDYDYQKLIRQLRGKLILTQEEFAKLLGVSFASVNRWERGHHEPTTKAKRKIIELCRKNKVELITSKEEK